MVYDKCSYELHNASVVIQFLFSIASNKQVVGVRTLLLFELQVISFVIVLL